MLKGTLDRRKRDGIGATFLRKPPKSSGFLLGSISKISDVTQQASFPSAMDAPIPIRHNSESRGTTDKLFDMEPEFFSVTSWSADRDVSTSSNESNDFWDQLNDLPGDWSLISCNDNKQPNDPKTGALKSDWPNQAIPVANFCDLPRKWIQAVGLVLGPQSGGVLAVDFDASGYEEVFTKVTGRSIHDLPKTVAWSSGKSGRSQRAYRVNPEHWDLMLGRRAWKNKEDKTCLELRWCGQQSVILGAHPETDGYHWCEGCSPREVEVADAPDWLLQPLFVNKPAVIKSNPKSDSDEISRVLALLQNIEPRDNYDDWLRVGMVLKGVDESLIEDWIDWSRGSNCFDEQECIKKWASFKGDGVGIGTLYFLAEQDKGSMVVQNQVRSLAPPVGQTASRSELTYDQLLTSLLQAVKDEDINKEMELRAEIMGRFKHNYQQVEAALFNGYTRDVVGVKPRSKTRSLDLSRVEAMEWLLDAFIAKHDLTLLYGSAGCGKTTAALALARSVLLGEGFLNRQTPCKKGNVLFIASDSGATPLISTMQDMSMMDMPEVKEGPEKRFHVWASDSEQGMSSWSISLSGCIRLLEFVKENKIDAVFIDSCKAVCSGAGIEYSDNKSVTAILTHLKEVICPHTSVVLLNHDGTSKDASSGAKAWKEIPSLVHMIQRPDPDKHDGAKSFRQWKCVKSRLGTEWEIHFKYEDGQLLPMQATECIGTCLNEIIQLLQGSDSRSLHLNDIVKKLSPRFSVGTIKNQLSSAVKTRYPVIERIPGKKGFYRLKKTL